MSGVNYTLTGNSWSGVSVPVEQGEKPVPAPKGLIVTRAVQTKSGWVGQVIVDTDIVYESSPFLDSDSGRGSSLALEDVNQYVVDRVKRIFE